MSAVVLLIGIDKTELENPIDQFVRLEGRPKFNFDSAAVRTFDNGLLQRSL
jgi:hypothetical protein